MKGEARLRLRITAAAEKQVRAGHPWVVADSVREQNREGLAGELGVIYDRADRFLAVGFFDPDSPIRLRVLHTGKPLAIDSAFWRRRLEEACSRREGMFDANTTGYRLINGESDGWPGLVLDRYDTTYVIKLYTAAWFPRLDEILEIIRHRLSPTRILNHLSPARIVLRTSRNLPPLPPKYLTLTRPSPNPSASETCPSVIFQESGLRFEADVYRGQKTGFFLDQRENRRLVESLARGRAVLNAFSFSGGFSVYAARGGAKSVTDLDISNHALASARRNFQLNWPPPASSPCPHESIQADAFEWLAANKRTRFDLIVLDPPSLAKRETERSGAIRAYTKLSETGIRQLMPGGILVACSCSAHVRAQEFFNAVRIAARNSDRRFDELQTTGHAHDHHAGFAEAEYLKGIYLQF
jgi:23S rRNA (cytosine1962-C5)-methyltransferase